MRFAEVIGQLEVIEKLRHAKKGGRVAHAQLFLGPEGSGNLAIALAYAQYLLCPNSTDEDSCGICATCKKVAGLQYADLSFSYPYFNKPNLKETLSDDYSKEWRSRVLQSPYFSIEAWMNELTKENKQLHFSVPEAGNIVKKLSLKSYEGGYKIIIVWMTELIKADVANKLLKIVEEPPENTLFFFVANSAEGILNTILSRVQIISIPKIAHQDMVNGLIAEGTSPDIVNDIAHYADGNWEVAYRLKDNSNPSEFLAVQFQTWMRHCYSKKLAALYTWSEQIAALSREDQKHFILYALDQMRQNLILNYSNENLARFTLTEKNFASKFSPFINHLNIEDIMEELESAHKSIGQNVNSKILFFELSIRMFRLLQRKEA